MIKKSLSLLMVGILVGCSAPAQEEEGAVSESQDTVVQVSDDDGLAEVSVNGRPRVRDIRLSRAVMQDADQLDQVLTRLLNDALGQARANTQDAVLAALPADVRDQASGSEEML